MILRAIFWTVVIAFLLQGGGKSFTSNGSTALIDEDHPAYAGSARVVDSVYALGDLCVDRERLCEVGADLGDAALDGLTFVVERANDALQERKERKDGFSLSQERDRDYLTASADYIERGREILEDDYLARVTDTATEAGNEVKRFYDEVWFDEPTQVTLDD